MSGRRNWSKAKREDKRTQRRISAIRAANINSASSINTNSYIKILKFMEMYLTEKGYDTEKLYGPRGIFTGVKDNKTAKKRMYQAKGYINQINLNDDFFEKYRMSKDTENDTY